TGQGRIAARAAASGRLAGPGAPGAPGTPAAVAAGGDPMTADPGTWLHCGTPRPEAGQRLVCFPHAGGSASFFRAWGSNLPGIEVHAVRYPGRGERISEPPPTDLRQLGDEIAAAVASGPDDRPL